MSDDAIRIIDDWERDGIGWVRFELPDLHGTARAKLVPVNAARGYAKSGLNFYGGAQVLDTRSDVVPGSLYNTELLYADQLLFPDPTTAAVVPWQPGHARFICSAHSIDGTPRLASPRQVLDRVLAAAAEHGYTIRSGQEYENYFFTSDGEPLFSGWHIFNALRNMWNPLVQEVLDVLPRVGIDLITANCEYGPGQFELNYGPGDGLAGPDKSYTYKNAVKEIAHKQGFIASFMSKPISGMAGCGAHFHVSLIDTDSDRSVMADDDDTYGLSVTAKQFLAGNLKYAAATYTLLVPTINCLKRRRPHTFSPSNISWGVEDRSALLRIKGGDASSRHIEHRAPSGMSNPYLVAAAVTAAGLLGIRQSLSLPDPSGPSPAEDDPRFTPLPTTINDSLAAFEAAEPLRALLGQEFCTVWSTIRRYELQRFDDHVTDWERNEYLEVY